MLENTEGAIKNGQSRETGSRGHTRRKSLLVLLTFFFWPLWCLFFFDVPLLITPLVSSNSS